jgi:hypothetical protein
MTRGAATRVAAGVLLLGLAVVALLLAHGVDQAGRELQALHAAPVASTPAVEPGVLQEAGERLLGGHARSELLRAYRSYRAGLADVIPGTTHPQTQARWNAIAAITRLRPSLDAADRAAADVVLGRVYASAAVGAGPTTQRAAMRDSAIAAFRRAVLGDTSNAAAKHDLELLLAEAGAAEARARSTSGRRTSDGKPAAVPRSEVEGSGY